MEHSAPAEGGEGSYAVLARLLTAYYGIRPPLDRRQVHNWHRRQTRNQDGKPFPAPAREVQDPRRGQPHFLFSVPDVIAWYQAGVPDRHNSGWREPGE